MNDVDTGSASLDVMRGIAHPLQHALAQDPSDLLLTLARLEHTTPKSLVSGQALILRSELRSDRNRRPYVALTLRFADGAILDARWWQFPHPACDCPSEGAVYHFTGYADSFNGCRQFRVVDAHPLPHPDFTPFCAAIRRPFAELILELDATIARLDEPMATLVRAVISGETYTRFCTWPAAQRHHGAVRHGLLAHSLRVADLALGMASAFPPDQLTYDRSLVITAALLHDVGKVRTLPAIAGAVTPEAATHFDHVTLGILMVQQAAASLALPLEPARLDALLHAILAHHGRPEWGTTVEPKTTEAWLVHVADLAEARLWAYSNQADTPQPAPAYP